MNQPFRVIFATCIIAAYLFISFGATNLMAQPGQTVAQLTFEKLNVTICHMCPDEPSIFIIKVVVKVLQGKNYNPIQYEGDLNDKSFSRVGIETSKHKEFIYDINEDIIFTIPNINNGTIKIKAFVSLMNKNVTTDSSLYFFYRIHLKNGIWTLENSEDGYKEGMYDGSAGNEWKWTASLVCKFKTF